MSVSIRSGRRSDLTRGWVWLVKMTSIFERNDYASNPGPAEQAVIVHFNDGSTDLKPLFALEDKLESAIKQVGAGELDGDEVASDGHDGYIYMYGPSADKLFDAIKPVLTTAPFMKNAKVVKRYEPPDGATKQTDITL